MSRSPQERHRPQKRWGQNFLRNAGAVRRIVEATGAGAGDLVLEIGPGEGVLTEPLIRTGSRVRVIEIDPSLALSLSTRFGESIEIIEGDATVAALPDEPFVAVGNLPYNVATPIIRRVLESGSWRRAVFMVQKEVADRITAGPGDEAYGYLSLVVRMNATPRQLMTLEPGSFHPPPKIRSAVVVFERGGSEVVSPKEDLVALISTSFRMRRKKLINNIEGFRGLGRDRIATLLTESGLGRDVRAEEMSLESFDQLCVLIERLAGDRPAPLPSDHR